MDLKLTETRTELTAWRRAHGKAHLPPWLKKEIVALLERFSVAELSKSLGIPLATLSSWKKQSKVSSPNTRTAPELQDFVELPQNQVPTSTSHAENTENFIELFLRNGTIRAVMSMDQFQTFLAQEGAA